MKLFIDLAQSLFDELDTHPHYKIHYIGLGASNCTGIHQRKSFSILEIEKDTKHAKLTQGLMKIRDKYGVDMRVCKGEGRVSSILFSNLRSQFVTSNTIQTSIIK
ncbi:hypothetical protein FA592_14240 (plasmid) [Sulfurospirillum diekertiae]|nr:hypothetical protein FA592_14240 [Sulfurospirillum diekertiae]